MKCRFPDTASEKVMHAMYVSIIMHKNMEMLIDSYRISPSRYECYTTAFCPVRPNHVKDRVTSSTSASFRQIPTASFMLNPPTYFKY